MATSVSYHVVKEFNAGADLSSSQFLFLEWDGSDATVANAITDVPVGVLQNKPTADRAAEVVMLGGTKLVAGGAITAGDLIGVDTSGRAVALTVGTDTTAYILGRALSSATGAGIIISAMINCINPARAQ